jgi:hypothetical protein
LPISLYIIAFFAATTAWLASGDTTNCALAASCQTTDDEVFGAGATFNDDRGSAADNNVVMHGDTVDNVFVMDAATDTINLAGTINGTNAVKIGFGGLSSLTAFDTAGTFTFNVPTGVTRLYVECAGAGGGGAGGSVANGAGAGGGAGGYSAVVLDATGIASLTIDVGTGGTAGVAGGAGGAGGPTVVNDGTSDVCRATGGGGGGANNGTVASGGSPGNGTDGDVTLGGGLADDVAGNAQVSGAGAASRWGTSGAGVGMAGGGIQGGPASGGSGAADTADGGGPGGDGIVFVNAFN